MPDTTPTVPTDSATPAAPRDLITHPKCGRSWSGLSRSHCPVCCRTFSCDSAADRHRKGLYGGGRHCVDPATVGLVARQMPWGEMWQNPGPEDGFGRHRPA